MVSALNFKRFDRGAIRGFFDLRYHGLIIKSCRLMAGSKGLWVALPQQKVEQAGETKYIEQLCLTAPEAQHVRALVLAELEHQGAIDRPAREKQQAPSQQGRHITPEGEDVSENYTNGVQDDIPF